MRRMWRRRPSSLSEGVGVGQGSVFLCHSTATLKSKTLDLPGRTQNKQCARCITLSKSARAMHCTKNNSDLVSTTCLRGAAPVCGGEPQRLQGLECHRVAGGYLQLTLVFGLVVVLEVIFNVIVVTPEIMLWSEIAGGVAPIFIQKKKPSSKYLVTNMMELHE